MATTRSGVGGTTGSPSVRPRSHSASWMSSWAPTAKARETMRPSVRARRAASRGATIGSRVRLAQPGRRGGRPARAGGGGGEGGGVKPLDAGLLGSVGEEKQRGHSVGVIESADLEVRIDGGKRL